MVGITLASTSCSDRDAQGMLGPICPQPTDKKNASTKATPNQATAIANLFASIREDMTDANKSTEAKDLSTTVSYYIDNGDTLLYAFNYGEDDGYIIVSADLSHFPIVAKADSGRIDFSIIDESDPFSLHIQQLADNIRNDLTLSAQDTTYTALWADISKPEFDYEISLLTEDKPTTNKATRVPTGKTKIFPMIGIALASWGQYGDYDSAAKAGHIGCPAMAIGMLLYDVQHREFGNWAVTNPSFHVDDRYMDRAKQVSKNLRIIADLIPNYQWDKNKNHSSGVSNENDILQGLRNIGFTTAKVAPFNAETAYKELCTAAQYYMGVQQMGRRGILLCGYDIERGGHIWFCDGYWEMSYKVTKRRGKKIVSTWNEYANFFYMNWGWGGKENGWYGIDKDNPMTTHAKTPHRYNVSMFTGLNTYTPL